MGRLVARLLLPALLLSARPATTEVVTKSVGRLSAMADLSLAYPGGLVVVHLRRPLGTVYAALLGRRVPFLDSPHGPRALVPVPVNAAAGPATLGLEVLVRRGRQRVPVGVAVTPRAYPARTVVIPESRRHLLKQAGAVSDGRRLLVALRTFTPAALWTSPFRPPVDAASVASFGSAETYVGGSPVNPVTDAIFGEYHRGADYAVPAGTAILAPATGTVVLASYLTLTGHTLVLDHGQGVVSAFYHLGRIDVREGERVEARGALGVSGDTGIAASPHLHWGTYVHGVAVDPEAIMRLAD